MLFAKRTHEDDAYVFLLSYDLHSARLQGIPTASPTLCLDSGFARLELVLARR